MKNPKLTQACTNMIKVIRSHIGLLSSLTASNERNEVLDGYRILYWKAVQDGRDPNQEVERALQVYLKRLLAALTVEQEKAQAHKASMSALAQSTEPPKAMR